MNATVDTKPRLPGLISLILVIVLGITLAKLMWLIVSPDKVTISQAQTNNSTAVKQTKDINYGKLIANHHLFGKVAIKKTPVKKAPPPKPQVAVVTPSKLNLKLHGIIAYKNKKQGFALISSGSGSQKVFGKGDKIQDGVTVREVLPTKVVINNNGTIEELILPIKKGKSKPQKRRASSFELGGNSAKVSSAPRQPQRTAPTQPNSFNLSQFRQEAMSSGPQKLLEIATPSPVTRNGKFIGFRIQPGRLRKAFRDLGFRPNDIVTEVNGIILDDANKAAMVLANLSQASQISLTVLRGRQEINIEHNF